MEFPEELKYTEEHEWVMVEEELAVVGITDFAQDALGDVVFVELPEVGSSVEAGKAFGVVESVKAVSDVYAPLTGTIEEIKGRKVVVSATVTAGGDLCATGEVVAVQRRPARYHLPLSATPGLVSRSSAPVWR